MNIDETHKFINEGCDFLNYFGHIRITFIDTIRDGGTKLIKTRKDNYYIDKITNKFHTDCPTTSENEIKDPLFCSYLIERIRHYIGECEGDVMGLVI